MRKYPFILLLSVLFLLGLGTMPLTVSAEEDEHYIELEYILSDPDCLSYYTPYIRQEYPTQIGFNKKGKAKITWTLDYYMKPDQRVDIQYEVQLADNPEFTDTASYLSSKESITLKKKAFGKNGGLFYLRARSVFTLPDGTILYSDWGETQEYVFVKINKTNFADLCPLLLNGGIQYSMELGDYEKVIYDRNGDHWLDPKEIAQIYHLQTTGIAEWINGVYHSSPDYPVSQMKGLSYLIQLHSITLEQYGGTVLDLTGTTVDQIHIQNAAARELTVIAPTTSMISIDVDHRSCMDRMDFSACPAVVELYTHASSGNKMTTLILPKQKDTLKILSIASYAPAVLNLNEYTQLHQLYLYYCDLDTLQVDQCQELRYLYFYICDRIKQTDVTANKKLIGTDASYCKYLSGSDIKVPKSTQVKTDAGKWWMSTEAYLEDLREIYPHLNISFRQ